MPEEWLEIVRINFTKILLTGRIRGGRDEHHVTIEHDVEQILTDEQREQVEALLGKQRSEMDELLFQFVDRSPLTKN